MSSYAKDVLVEPDWLQEHLGDEGLRIVEVDENPKLYAEAHIPGAIGFDWKVDLQDPVRRDFLGAQAFSELFGSNGISDEDTIVRRLWGPEQLVRGVHVLVSQVLRPRAGAAAQRSS
jgi:thiosulfate/3-mercaptopyruvate sulfurtransferase